MAAVLSPEEAIKAHIEAVNRDYVCEPRIGKYSFFQSSGLFSVVVDGLLSRLTFSMQSIGPWLASMDLLSLWRASGYEGRYMFTSDSIVFVDAS